MKAACKVLMMGTHPDGKGGIATVVAVLQEQGFFERNQVRYIATHAQVGALRKLLTAMGAMATVGWICLVQRPAIVHVHSASGSSFYRKSLILLMARLFGRKTIFHLHGAEFRQFAYDKSGPLGRWWIRRTLAGSSVVVALSESWSGFLHALSPTAHLRVVFNSVSLPVLPQPLREEAGRILFLGRAEKRKGIFVLLEAMALLKQDFPEIMLVVGGDGNLDAVARAVERLQLGAHVSIMGWISAAERNEQLARAAIFTLPSHDEGLPMSMLEAMAAAKAVVVTPVGGIPEAVEDQVNGLLVAPGDAAALAAAFRTLLTDVALRRRIGERARATVAARFSTEVVMEQLAGLYRELEGPALP